MANSLINLNHTLLAEKVLQAFVQQMVALRAFSLSLSEANVARGDKVKVPFVGASSGALDFNGSYVVQDADAEGVDVTINKRKYVSWGLTTEDLANQPQLNLDMFAMQKGHALAKSVFQDILSVVTAANFGNTVADKITVAAGSFDVDDTVDLRTMCQAAGWPNVMRSLLLDSTYIGNLLKEDALQSADKANSDAALREGSIGRVSGFDTFDTPLIPENGESLKGMAVFPDAILVASRVLIPEDQDIVSIETFTDPYTGATLVMREWFDPDTDTKKRVIEFNYGYRVGNGKAIKRIVAS